ncbi:hypothetical protein [Francisella philomiragia]|uniref:hypothetical protein n=1 Tax=Francisella philomiragia TaxID=28110 RepID=UPI00224357EB|nr:hypothetical protein [Francisella philomiragia]
MNQEQTAYTNLRKKLKEINHYNYLTTDSKTCTAVIYEKKEIKAKSWQELEQKVQGKFNESIPS